MNEIHIFRIPYDSGHYDVGIGTGPGRLLERGLADRLRVLGGSVFVHEISPEDPFRLEIKTSFELYRRLAEEVSEQCAAGGFALVLSGNCGAALGGIAGLTGLHGVPPGVAWLDAHGDFNTPETTYSGYLDGMCLATAAGLGWKSLAASLPGFRPLPVENILHIGGRDFDPAEEALFTEHGLALARSAEVRAHGVQASLAPLVDALADRVNDLYVHFDVDVLDPAETPASQFNAPDGLSTEQAAEVIALLREHFTLRGLSVSSYNPTFDREGKTVQAVIDLVERALG